MASLNKQQKRAKRAKAKAKQIRTSGRVIPTMLDDPLTLDGLADVDNLFEVDDNDDEGLRADVHAMFCVMQLEEETSRIHMMVNLLVALSSMIVDKPELLDLENAENDAMAATNLATQMLMEYRMWADGIDREAAQRWLDDPEVIDDFGTALDSYKKAVAIMMEPGKPTE